VSERAGTDLHWLTAAEAARAIAARKLSPVELLEALLQRIDALDPRLNVFTCLDREGALRAARVAETEAMQGRLRGPLHGVPIGVKNIIDVAGLPTTCHSKIRQDHVATSDAICVQKLKAAGGIVVGMLAAHEFAIGGPSFDLPWPPARNPWNTDHHPGGSSSGSGAGLAAGFFPMALGTDTGGSVRHPASCCGLVGLKPTYGLVSRRGVFPLAFTLDHVGPMTRTVRDNALMLEAMIGHDPLDPGSAAAPYQDYAAALERPVRDLRIGFVRHFHEVDLPAEPEVAAALEQVADALRSAGAQVRDIRLPALGEFNSVSRVLVQCESWAIHGPWLRERPGDYARISRRGLMAGAFVGGGDYVQAQRLRLQLMARMDAAFREVDVLLCASSMTLPCRIDRPADIEATYARQARAPFNVTGHPAIAVMAGRSTGGLPLSVQFAGRSFDEATLFQVARAWELISGVDRQHPVFG
jgi:aspartyl-tRNA(Asn)/glutamyl-tRNA(Gln) amidotransferase subunit A